MLSTGRFEGAVSMCGIAGLFIAADESDADLQVRLQGTLQALRHRGPDYESVYRDGCNALVHTRLSILDLSSAGNQPMQSPCGRYVIAYNGEVYNFKELAVQYGMRDLRSASDTEIVLQLFAKLGVESFTKLNGMFAFAIYDRQQRKVWLARDRFGIKPLYYLFEPHSFAFASELRALRTLAPRDPVCDISALHEWLYYGNALGGRTLYDGIRQLRPGSYLELDLESFSVEAREYWTITQHAKSRHIQRAGKSCAVTETRRLLEQAVQRQIVSDVPVGIFLSGGVDSSAIAAFASRHYQGRLATYSVGFDFAKNGGELPKAKRVAKLYGTDHHEVHISGEHVADLVEKLVAHHDAPFSDAANIPLYLMATRISAATKVVLQGDGGDEVFGGYRRYTTLKYRPLLHPLARLLQEVPRIAPESALRHRVQRYLHAFAAPDIASTMALLLTAEDRDSSPSDVFLPPLSQEIARVDAFARVREVYAQTCDLDIGNQMSLVDLLTILPDIYLEKVDRATMAASLEVRVPFLDNDLVDHTVRLSGRSKMPWGRKKWLLKSALRGVVPDEILFGPKTGFSVPYGRWLQTSLRLLFFDHLNAFKHSYPGILNAGHIENLFSRTAAGSQNHSSILWKMLNFMVWANTTRISFQ